MSLEIKRIFLTEPNPNNEYCCYENQLQPSVTFGNSELEVLFKTQEDNIMEIVEKGIRDYVNCDDLCNDEEDMFPRRCFLTGEWYVSEIRFEDVDYLSICTALLGTDLGYKDDYLGLDVLLYYEKETGTFTLDGVNSEAL